MAEMRHYLRTDVPWTHPQPTDEDVLRAESEGREAAERGRHFSTDCPYTFDKFDGMTYAEFNGTQRPLLNAWFKGWQSAYRPPHQRTADMLKARRP